MKILVINPNISESITGIIEVESRRVASADTELEMRTAAFGFEYVETRFEALISAHAVAEEIAAHSDGCDAVVVAAFGDPGMPALKEIVGIPVVGITEAALHQASLVAPKFSIVAISDRITAWYLDCVALHGMTDRLASIRALNSPISNIATVRDEARAALLALVERCVQEDRADAVILAGAPLGGLSREIQDHVPVPLVDGISAGILQAEALVKAGVGAHRAGSLSFPARKRTRGLSGHLDAFMESGYLGHDGADHHQSEKSDR